VFKNRFFILATIISLIFIQLMTWIIFLNRQVLPPEIPLFYYHPWGKDQLAPASQIWILPAVSGGIFAVNTVIAWLIYKSDKFLAQALVFGTTILSGMGLFFLLRIINLVTP